MIDKRKEIIWQLVQARKELGLTQIDLANRLGMNQSNVSRIESGAMNVSIDTIIRIAFALGKDVKLLLKDLEEDPAEKTNQSDR